MEATSVPMHLASQYTLLTHSSPSVSFLCKDIWRAYGNETRIVMDPRVVVGVDEPAWEDVVLARSKKLPSYFKEAPFDVGIQPSPWRKLPEIDLSVGRRENRSRIPPANVGSRRFWFFDLRI